MVSTAGGIVIAIVVLLLAAAIGWVIFSQLRARRLGLPPPSLSSYLPWRKSDSAYGPPRPARGGIGGWFNDQVRKLKHGSNRSAAGAYEQPLNGGGGGGATRGNRGFGPLDPDDAWDTRVGHEADTYGYYEEQELGGGGGGGHSTEYSAGAYNSRLGSVPAVTADYGEEGRGRRMAPAHQQQQKNPFDDDAQASLRGVSPRPIDAGHRPTTERPGSHHERRSMFRENV